MNRIKELRKTTKIKQKEIAKRLGVTAGAVQLWESGKDMKVGLARELAYIFGVSVDYLMGYSDIPKPVERIDTPLSKGKIYAIEINEFIINLIRDYEKMTAQEVSNVKREARNLYEELVRLEYEVKEGKND